MGTKKKKNRLARKIVDRFTADPAAAAKAYDFPRVRLAHFRVGRPIRTPDRDKFMAAKKTLAEASDTFGGIPVTVTMTQIGGEKSEAMKGWAAVDNLPELESMSVADLKAEAKARKLKGYSKLKKTELIALLQGDGA